MLDHFKVLGIPPGATADEIKKAYYKLAKQYHPDQNVGNQEAVERFMQIKAAYNALIQDAPEAPQAQAKPSGVSVAEMSAQSSGASQINQLDMYYNILQLGPDASQTDVQSAYYRLIGLCNVDYNPGTEEHRDCVNNIEYAYKMLTGKEEQDPDDW